MKKFLIAILALLPTLTLAAGKEPHLLSANIDLRDQEALVKGAQLYVNYCMGCHSMKYQRYERTFNDLGIPLDLGLKHLMPEDKKVGQLMTNAMDVEDGARWFGAAPPDLTLMSRLKGAGHKGPDYIYTYLKSFYVDESRPFGVNNTVFPEVGMPHALIELQGVPRMTTEQRMVDGEMKDVEVGIKATGGKLSAAEYDEAVRNLVTFMAYVGEPSKLEGEAIGKKVLWFLLVLLVLVFLLKKEYWRDVH